MTVALRGMTTLLQVFDMSISLAFYRDILGFRICSTSGSTPSVSDADFYWAMLELDNVRLMLNTAYEEGSRPTHPEPARVSGHADTILYFQCEDADVVFAHLRRSDWIAEPPTVTHYGMKQVYTRDPDGYQVCFQQPAQTPPQVDRS